MYIWEDDTEVGTSAFDEKGGLYDTYAIRGPYTDKEFYDMAHNRICAKKLSMQCMKVEGADIKEREVEIYWRQKPAISKFDDEDFRHIDWRLSMYIK